MTETAKKSAGRPAAAPATPEEVQALVEELTATSPDQTPDPYEGEREWRKSDIDAKLADLTQTVALHAAGAENLDGLRTVLQSIKSIKKRAHAVIGSVPDSAIDLAPEGL